MRCAVFIQVCAALALATAATVATANAPQRASGEPAPLPILSARPVGVSDPLPDLAVGPVSVARASAFEALRLVLGASGSGIGLTYAGAAMPEGLRRPVAAVNLEGHLPGLIEQLAQVAGFYYRYNARARVLTVAEDEDFALALPADPAQAAALKNRLVQLGAHGLDTARFPGLLTYRAARATEEAIAQELAGPEPLGPRAQAEPVAKPMPERLTGQPSGVAAATRTAAANELAQPASEGTPWRVRTGEKLSETFRRWGARSGWRLIWQAPELQARLDASLTGTFEHAVTEVVRSLDENGARLHPIFYGGNRVLRITGDGDE